MRLPAGDGSAINATYRSTAAGMQYRRIYKLWLTQRMDLSPRQFATQNGPKNYADAEEWRIEFVAYLVSNAVVQDPGLLVDLGSTAVVSMLEAALGHESRLYGLQETQLLSAEFGVLDPSLVKLVQSGLTRIALADYNFDNVVAAYESASQPGQALERVAQWIVSMFMSSADGTRSDAFIASRFIVSGDDDYLVRLLQLPGALAALTADATLADRLADSDADNAANAAELKLPLVKVTLPWIAD
jgi:hypothetical protein